MIKMRKIGKGVFSVMGDFAKIGSKEIKFLKKNVNYALRRRSRLCIHRNSEDAIQEMIIVISNKTYIRPHKHLNNCESFHVIEGEAYAVFFTEKGKIKETVRLSAYHKKGNFYLRIPRNLYHSFIVASDSMVFHETKVGPFRIKNTAFPSWAPQDKDAIGVKKFISKIRNKIEI